MFGFKVPIIVFYVNFLKFTLKLMRVVFASPGICGKQCGKILP